MLLRADALGFAKARPRPGWGDLVAAGLISLLLTIFWVLNDWEKLRHLTLPDTDDMMRLAQIRDWIGGQSFNDWTQYRMAPPEGGAMHWSRIADLGPAAIIVLLSPYFGTQTAELIAVIAWPATLFALFLLLCARISVRVGGDAARLPGLVLGALAYPAASLFLPGRIDHHGIQIVLLLAAMLALLGKKDLANGAAAGTAIALGMVVGLEAAPQFVALMVALFAAWVRYGADERQRLCGFGGAILFITTLAIAIGQPRLWNNQWCDAFTPASASAALIAGFLFILYALIGDRLGGWKRRLVIGGLIGSAGVAALVLRYPTCLTGPYGPVDPFVQQAFLDKVSEARGLFEQRLWGMALPSIGMMLVATILAAWYWYRHPPQRWQILPILLALGISDMVVLAQIRGAYLGSAIAVPVLALWVSRVRRSSKAPALLTAWLLSAGMIWLVVPDRIGRLVAPAIRAEHDTRKACKTADVWHRLDRYPPGVVMAPIDMGAYIIAGSHHSAVAAGYHRSNAGNRAMYSFFLSSPNGARKVAAGWQVDYVAICDRDFSEIGVTSVYPDSLASRLQDGSVPDWLIPLPIGNGSELHFYRVLRSAP